MVLAMNDHQKEDLISALVDEPAPDFQERLLASTRSMILRRKRLRSQLVVVVTSTGFLLPLILLFLAPASWLFTIVLNLLRAMQDAILYSSGWHGQLMTVSTFLSVFLVGFAVWLLILSTRFVRTGG